MKVLLLLLQAALVFSQPTPILYKVLQWNQIDYEFPDQTVRNTAIQQGKFNQKSVFPIDADCDYYGTVASSRIFITTPRFTNDVPIVLGYMRSPSTTNKIYPYPNYSWHSSHGKDCDGITSVLRIWIDECRQLWVMDTGKIGDTQWCAPQILVFDLRTDHLIWRYRFPSSQYDSTSLFITPIVDVSDPGSCKKVKVYIADVTGFALLVYDSWLNKSWRIRHSSFYPISTYSKFTIAGQSFDLMDGLFSLALSPKSQTTRYLYYHPLASIYEYAVPLNVINDPNINWASPSQTVLSSFKQIGTGRGPIGVAGGQTPMSAMDCNGNLWFVLLKPLALFCWDSATPYSPSNFRMVVQNDTSLQFASGLKIKTNLNYEEEVWITTIRFQKIANGNINPAEINYRVQARTISVLLNGYKKCNGLKYFY